MYKTLLRGFFLSIFVCFLSVSSLAKTFSFNFPMRHETIFFNLGKETDEIIYVDKNGDDKTLLTGKLTAFTTSGIDIKKNGKVQIFEHEGRKYKIKNTVHEPLAIVFMDGQYYVIDLSGTVYPLPKQKDESQWNSDWETADYTDPDTGNAYKIVVRTDVSERSLNTRTNITVIRQPQGTYATKIISTASHNPFSLSTVKIVIRNDSVAFVDGDDFPFIDAQNKEIQPFLFSAMKPVQVNTPLDYAAYQPTTKTDLARIKKHLEEKIIGQPEVVDYFYNLEVKKYLYGSYRNNSEHVVLMGLPGVGKDTTVHAFVDAINNQEGSWQNNNHMFKMPVISSSSELWAILGSTTGHIGSENIPDFIKFLIRHSGGKYKIETEQTSQGTKSWVSLNPSWKPGDVLENYYPPEKAVIFVNEMQNWSKQAKDRFLKQALDGVITLNNPERGESTISLPMLYVFATNEGSNLLVPRKANGEQINAKSMTYESIMSNWEAAHSDQRRLDNELMKTNGGNGGRQSDSPGNSEEFANRLTNKILYRPLSPETLKSIVRAKLEELKKIWAASYVLTWDESVVTTIQEYMYEAEKNGRPMDEKINKMIETPLLEAVSKGDLEKDAKKNLTLTIKRNPDKTFNLIATSEAAALEIPIQYTAREKLATLKTDEELERTIDLPRRLKTHVFGAERVADELGKDILVSDEASHANLTPENATEPAHNYLFLGPSSVGKTEMISAFALEHKGSRDAMKLIDFSQISTKEHMKEKILGTRDGNNNAIPSDYMLEYDARNGDLIVALDEAANAPLEALKALYDLLREPVVRTFSDGRPRVMSRVYNILTGNGSEEWYSAIPANLPMYQQMAAMREIYERAMANPGLRRRTLEKYFSSAFIARVGEPNIFWFGPLDFKAIRELTQLKLLQTLKSLEKSENRRTWKVRFATIEDYFGTLEMIETDGFVVREQGASIDRFVKQNFGNDLRAFLLTNKVPNGAEVVLSKLPEELKQDQTHHGFQISINGQNTNLKFRIEGRVKESLPPRSEEDQILSAFHEAGHELARKVLFGAKYKASKISVIPGVAAIGDQMVVYEGIAVSEQEERFAMTAEAVIRELAVSLAGTAAQELVSRNFVHDAGKANDTQQAVDLAQFAILKAGLSEIWGTEAVPKDMSINQYLASLSEDKRNKYEAALAAMLAEAKLMADSVMLTNTSALITLGTELAEKGEFGKEDIENFYLRNSDKINFTGFRSLMVSSADFKTEHSKWIDPLGDATRALGASLSSLIPRPQKIADIDKLILASKTTAVAKVALPDNPPVLNASSAVGKCETMLRFVKHRKN